jgi:hypothetical protein
MGEERNEKDERVRGPDDVVVVRVKVRNMGLQRRVCGFRLHCRSK